MDEDSKRFLDEKLQVFRQTWENKIRLVEARFYRQRQDFAQMRITSVRTGMELSLKEAERQYQMAMAKADNAEKVLSSPL